MTKNEAPGTDTAVTPSISAEFEGADLGDLRRSTRLVKVAEALSKAPSASIPEAMPRRADEDAAYRFLSSAAVTPDALLAPHMAQVVERAGVAKAIVIAHDTTEFEFGGSAKRAGMGRLAGSRRQGFFGHFSLAITANAERRPLGLLGLHTWARTSRRRSSKKSDGRHRNGTDYAKIKNKESQRWLKQVRSAEQQVGSRAEVIHLMDRESDAFPLLAAMVSGGNRFVARLARDRVARADQDHDRSKVRALVAEAQDVLTLEVPVAARKAKRAPRANETSGARQARVASLGLRATRTELRRPPYLTEGPRWLPVNIVEVHEIDPPQGAEPVEWLLVTSEPIETIADVHAVVLLYSTRWIIEEYFKALKTGCAIGKRQLETYDAVVNLLAIFAPIAWQMLALRDWARRQPDAPASVVLSPTQIDVLRVCGNVALPQAPTVRQALFAVAALGGHHIPREPGWIVLGRGMEKLLLLEAGWTAHMVAAGKM
jgi:hypothetical protein